MDYITVNYNKIDLLNYTFYIFNLNKLISHIMRKTGILIENGLSLDPIYVSHLMITTTLIFIHRYIVYYKEIFCNRLMLNTIIFVYFFAYSTYVTDYKNYFILKQ